MLEETTLGKGGNTTFPSDYDQLLNTLEEKKQKEKKKNPFPKEIQARYFNQAKPRENYDDYLFTCHDFVKLTGGIPKPLTESQLETYNAYKDRYLGIGKPLTEKQEETFFKLGAKVKSKVTLSDAAKKHLQELIRNDQFARRKVVETKYMDKGIEGEDQSLELYSEFIGIKLTKNTERKSNKYFIGEADNTQGKIRDIKTTWEFATFPYAAIDLPSIYEWQVQNYMDLWNMDEAEVIYLLVDTPTRLIHDEVKRLDWKYDIMTIGGDIRKEAIPLVVEKVSGMIYTVEGLVDLCEESPLLELKWFENEFVELPIEKRVKVFPTTKNYRMLAQAKQLVILAREYMNQTLKEIL